MYEEQKLKIYVLIKKIQIQISHETNLIDKLSILTFDYYHEFNYFSTFYLFISNVTKM